MKTKPVHDVYPDTWSATDALGRRLPGWEECGSPRPDRFVGIFYFICNNYDGPDQPYDVTKTIAENAANPPFVGGKPYYWGEPEPGYYRSSDRWVIRRHAYLLADAGVDTLIFDVTNDVTYPDTYEAICEVFSQIRQEGEATPDICFLADFADDCGVVPLAFAGSDTPLDQIDVGLRQRQLLLVRCRLLVHQQEIL